MTPTEMFQTLQRMVAVFGRPYGVEPDVLAQEAQRAWSGLSWFQLDRAITHLDRPNSKRPSPGQLAHVARELDAERARRRGMRQGVAPPPEIDQCARCQRLHFVAGFELPSGVVGRVRCGCRQGSPRWQTPRALAYRDAQLPAPSDYDPFVWDVGVEPPPAAPLALPAAA